MTGSQPDEAAQLLTEAEDFWLLWTGPYSAMLTLPGYKALMRETGLTDYWRQSGDWGDVCRPAGDDDFECG